VVIREDRLEVSDIMIIEMVEKITCDVNALFKAGMIVKIDHVLDFFELSFCSRAGRVLA